MKSIYENALNIWTVYPFSVLNFILSVQYMGNFNTSSLVITGVIEGIDNRHELLHPK